MVIDFAVLTMVILGVTQVIKMAFNMPSRFAPLCALALGILAVTVGKAYLPADFNIFHGIIAALSAMGLWSGTKTVASSEAIG